MPPRIQRTKIADSTEDLRKAAPLVGCTYEKQDFVECRWWGADFRNCLWQDCRFYRSKFGHETKFQDCAFRKCEFRKAHGSMAGSYRRCLFEDCLFSEVLMEGVHFEDCTFSGTMKDLIFYGEELKVAKNRAIFKNVDLTGVQFVLTDFRLNVNLRTVKFGPQPGSLYINGAPWSPVMSSSASG